MFTRLLAIKITASSLSLSEINEYAFWQCVSSLSSRKSSISAGVRLKYAISLPDTNAEIDRHMHAIITIVAHPIQLSGAINSAIRLSNIERLTDRHGVGKGSVSKIIK
jgi:hypothetical protein